MGSSTQKSVEEIKPVTPAAKDLPDPQYTYVQQASQEVNDQPKTTPLVINKDNIKTANKTALTTYASTANSLVSETHSQSPQIDFFV